MAIALRIVASLLVACAMAAAGGYAGLELPTYHAHDMVGPLLGLILGAGAGFCLGLLLALLLAFVAMPPKPKFDQ